MDMRIADWSEKLCFGIDPIDRQHQQLFELAASFEGNGDQIRVMKTLVILCDYVREHFREEEALLAACGYPKLESHRALHREFRRLLRELLDQAPGMTLDQIAERVRYLINGWFYNHILVVDLDYAPQVKAYLARKRARDAAT